MQTPWPATPKPLLQTERLLLRCPGAGDGAAMYQAIVESLPALRQWAASLPWARDEPSLVATETFCRRCQTEFQRGRLLVYLVLERHTQALVGCTSLHAIDWATSSFELGYWCRTSQLRRGYMREATTALVHYLQGELGAERISCVTDARNTRSRHLCESLGMRLEQLVQQPAPWPELGRQHCCIYALETS